MRSLRIALFAGLMALPLAPAMAQEGQPPLKALDFDLWCTEEMHIPYERCALRTSEDMQAFEAYRDKIEKYETLQRRAKAPGVYLDTLISGEPGAQPAKKTDGEGK